MAAGERADINNSALLEAKLLDRLLNGENRPKHVRREFAIEFRNGDTLERFEFEDSGVVYQDVKLSKCCLGLREKAFDVLWIGDACLDGNGVAATVRYFGEPDCGAMAPYCCYLEVKMRLGRVLREQAKRRARESCNRRERRPLTETFLCQIFAIFSVSVHFETMCYFFLQLGVWGAMEQKTGLTGSRIRTLLSDNMLKGITCVTPITPFW
jgi:hypothetical protein